MTAAVSFSLALLIMLILAAAFAAGLGVGHLRWADPGRCNQVVGSASSITAGNVRELTVTCLVERTEP